MTLDALRARATLTRDGYRVFDGEYAQMSCTLEDCEFLYALVRVTKPALVLELGTGLGVSARFIAEALAANDANGTLLTIEPNYDFYPAIKIMLAGLRVDYTNEYRLQPNDPDLVFIDSGYDRREADIADWLSGDYRGLVCVHDAGRGYPGLALGTGVYLPGSDGLWVGRVA